MIAWINGVLVQGSPEEIERYRMITAEKKTAKDFFKIPVDDVPEHVKNYGKHGHTYVLTGRQVHQVWY